MSGGNPASALFLAAASIWLVTTVPVAVWPAPPGADSDGGALGVYADPEADRDLPSEVGTGIGIRGYEALLYPPGGVTRAVCVGTTEPLPVVGLEAASVLSESAYGASAISKGVMIGPE